MNEASKTRRMFNFIEDKIFQGKGIDIGCGLDPIYPSARGFDIGEGDANEITKYVKEQFDYVFSSHCLEHMYNPYKTIRDWWKLVKPKGYMCIVVPDEDLYEQKQWPSKWNSDHKNTFTIDKRKSWSPVSVNIVDLISILDDCRVIKIERQDYNYDYSKLGFDQTLGDATAQIYFILQKDAECQPVMTFRGLMFRYFKYTNKVPDYKKNKILYIG
jgi:predicted SAM-dependent methyltransferase